MTDCNESHDNKPRIMVWGLNQAGLIILGKSGVIYHNQTGGNNCMQRCEEGYLVPLADCYLVKGSPIKTYQCPIEEELGGMIWAGFGVDEERALQIDDLLRSSGYTKGLSVDRQRMHESEEAWVYVNVKPVELAAYSGFGSCKGVLVWANSD